MGKSKIDFCDYVFNPKIGCTYGCAYCYAGRQSDHWKWIRDFSKPEWSEKRFSAKFPSNPVSIFVGSLGGIADYTLEELARVHEKIEQYPQHDFIFLTKRYRFFLDVFQKNKIEPANAWYGFTIATGDLEATAMQISFRVRAAIELLTAQKITGKIKGTYLSIEPMMWDDPRIAEGIKGVDAVIVGGLTGCGKYTPNIDVVLAIRDRCKSQNILLFEKGNLGVSGRTQKVPWVLEAKK